MSQLRGVYLAYPIDQYPAASSAFLYDQIEAIKKMILDRKLADWVFDPGDAFTVGRNPTGGGVALINRCALNTADLIIAFLPANTPSIGVPMEIDRAHAQGKNIIVFSNAQSYMLELPNLVRYDDWHDEHIGAALDVIGQMEPPIESRQHRDLPFKIATPGCLPKRSYDDDAGLDLIVSEDTIVPANGFADIPCGVSVELPSSTWALVTGRSSALRKRGLLVHSGIIDPGYRGPLFAGAWNQTGNDVVVVRGDRIAQLILMNNQTQWHTPIAVETLAPSMRGERGFGSTGI